MRITVWFNTKSNPKLYGRADRRKVDEPASIANLHRKVRASIQSLYPQADVTSTIGETTTVTVEFELSEDIDQDKVDTVTKRAGTIATELYNNPSKWVVIQRKWR